MFQKQPSPQGTLIRILVVIILIIVAAAAIYFLFFRPLFGAKAETYQAVFLSNGQVYFGKITNLNKNYAQLKDIYYLQLRKPLQTQEPPPAENEQGQLTLVKLGNELHGPKDQMTINRQHILFIENLKQDSKVMEAIRQYKSGAPVPNNQSGAQPPASKSTPKAAPSNQAPEASPTPPAGSSLTPSPAPVKPATSPKK